MLGQGLRGNRELYARLRPRSLFFFPFPDLVDDERREHWGDLPVSGVCTITSTLRRTRTLDVTAPSTVDLTQEARRRFIPRVLGLMVLLGGTVVSSPGGAQRDFDPGSTAWNGLSGLVEAAADANVRLDTPERLDVADLSPTDAIVLVHPDRELPVPSLSAFLRAGGRVVLADDFGGGGRFLESFGIVRVPPNDPPRTIRGNPDLPVAHVVGRHPLTDGISMTVANHAQTLRHPELTPLLAFDDAGSQGLVLTGAVERGRLVAIGDSSVLINNMLQFEGNRRLATNLMRYLGEGRSGRVYLITPGTPLVGRYGGASGAPVERLGDALRDLASAELPPTALTLLALVLVAILAVFAVSSLPRRSPYTADRLWGPEPVGGGFAGRVAFFLRRKKQLVHPALVYGYEVEAAIRRTLFGERASAERTIAEVVGAARERGLGADDAKELRALLGQFATLRQRADEPGGPPRVPPARLHHMVDSGERLIARLEEKAQA